MWRILFNTPILRSISWRILRLLRRLKISSDQEFPTMPYVFTRLEAKRVANIIVSGKLHHSMGSEVALLESEFASYQRKKYALATNAGTSALELAIKAIGIHPGDEIIVPAYTFVATAQAVLSRGGVPVFADIDDTFTISTPSIEKLITSRTKAIIPVHMFGNVADMDKIIQIAIKHKLRVIEDACQAVGAKYKGFPVGSLGDIGCFSFNTRKAITTGQGGMVVTSKKEYFDIMLITRETGQINETVGSDVITTGNTFSLTEMQASLARSILQKLDSLNAKRLRNYNLFTQCINTSSGLLRWNRILPNSQPSFSRLVLMIDFEKLKTTREIFIKRMNTSGIPMKTFYPVPLYKYSLFQKQKDTLTKSEYPFFMNKHVNYRMVHHSFVEKFCRQQVGLEFSPYLTDNHIYLLCDQLNQFIST